MNILSFLIGTATASLIITVIYFLINRKLNSDIAELDREIAELEYEIDRDLADAQLRYSVRMLEEVAGLLNEDGKIRTKEKRQTKKTRR